MNIIKYKKNDIYRYQLKKNGSIHNYYSYKYNQEIGIKGVIKKYYNFDYINFPNNLIKKYNNNNKFIVNYNLNLLLLYSYFMKNKDLYYVKAGNYKYVFLKNNIEFILKYLYIKKNIYEHKNLFKSYKYDVNNKIIDLIIEYIYLVLLHNKKYINDNEIYIKLFYKYYIKIIDSEIYLLYNKKYDDFPNYRVLYDFLKKKGYVDYYYKKLVPIIKKNYRKNSKISISKITRI